MRTRTGQDPDRSGPIRPDIPHADLAYVENERHWVTVETQHSKTACCGLYLGCQFSDDRNKFFGFYSKKFFIFALRASVSSLWVTLTPTLAVWMVRVSRGIIPLSIRMVSSSFPSSWSMISPMSMVLTGMKRMACADYALDCGQDKEGFHVQL